MPVGQTAYRQKTGCSKACNHNHEAGIQDSEAEKLNGTEWAFVPSLSLRFIWMLLSVSNPDTLFSKYQS